MRIGKGGKTRHVTLSDEGPELIERLVAGKAAGDLMLLRDDGLPWGKSQQKRLMDLTSERAGTHKTIGVCLMRQ
ncbi:MAG TPA: hypothetical protein VGJ01_10495 [Pseudolabrys sp.]